MEVARLALAAVFGVAALGKLVDHSGGRDAMRGFGVADRFATPAALALALGELLIGAALVPAATARVAAGAAIALLITMLAVTLRALAGGRSPACHCFGVLHSAPVGRGTVARIAALAALAGAVAVTKPGGPGPLGAAIVGAGSVVAVQGVALLRLLRRYGSALHRIEQLERGHATAAALVPGSTAPAFVLPNIAGRHISLDDLLAERLPVLLVFVDPMCGPCRDLLPRLSAWQGALAGRLTVAVVSGGGPEDVRTVIAPYGLRTILVRADSAVPSAYAAEATPSAVVIAPDGTIARGVAAGSRAIEELVPTVELPAARAPRAALAVTLAGVAAGAAGAASAQATTEQEELDTVRAAVDDALARQQALHKGSLAALRSVKQAGRSPAARRARARTRRRLDAARDDATRRRQTLEAVQLVSVTAENARQHILLFLKEREQFLIDLRRLSTASRGEAGALRRSADAHVQSAYSHLATAVVLTEP